MASSFKLSDLEWGAERATGNDESAQSSSAEAATSLVQSVGGTMRVSSTSKAQSKPWNHDETNGESMFVGDTGQALLLAFRQWHAITARNWNLAIDREDWKCRLDAQLRYLFKLFKSHNQILRFKTATTRPLILFNLPWAAIVCSLLISSPEIDFCGPAVRRGVGIAECNNLGPPIMAAPSQ